SHRRGNIGIAIFMHAGVNLLGTVVLIWGDSILDYLEDARDAVESVVAFLGIG
nr:hypothetical protein [Actinomycetota bacterium]NIU17915.1 hypothetical protein [Actinomycetota bacterium]NIU64457.1 hypothetical protein [Actinomycetota bacterium]